MFSEVVSSFCTNRFSKLDCKTLKDGADTNTQAEEFFRIKKNTTFKEKRRDRVDSFIKENYKDNSGLQHQFAYGILSSIKDKDSIIKGMKFVADQLSQANARISDADKLDTSDNESDDDFIAQSTEQWEKGVKRKSNSIIKGTYVSLPKKPLFFSPVQNAKNADDLPSKDKKHLFQSFKKDMWSKLPKKMKGSHTRNRTTKSLWEQKKKQEIFNKKIARIKVLMIIISTFMSVMCVIRKLIVRKLFSAEFVRSVYIVTVLKDLLS